MSKNMGDDVPETECGGDEIENEDEVVLDPAVLTRQESEASNVSFEHSVSGLGR